MEGLSAEPLDAADRDALAAALGRERLPTGDLGEPGRQFFACRDAERRTLGFAGLEHPGAGTVALLRSLVTLPAFRGRGVGRAMVEELAARAAAQGVTELYLLTTTAAPFFETVGFEPVARSDVPAAIAGTREFTSLCPASAVTLRRRLPLAPPPDRFNIARYCLAENARRQPDKTALVIAGDGGQERRWSFAGLDRAVRRLAGALRELGARPGQRLMIRMDNDIAGVLTFFASLAAGLVPLPSAAALTGEEALFLLADAEAGLFAVSDALVPHQGVPVGVRVLSAGTIRHLAETGPAADYADTGADDPAFLIYTSGTTARPKGVLHAHRSAWGRRPMYQGWSGIGADDIVLHAGAFNWTYTLGVGLIDPWANGSTAILYNGRSDPAVWPALIERFGVTLFATVPSLYRRILKYADADAVPGADLRTRLRSLRHGLTAGEALPPALGAAWRARTGKALFEALGMSEISTYVSTGPGMALKPGSPGRPQPGRRVAILDPDAAGPRPLPAGAVGLLAVHRSDPGLMLGYWRRPEEEALVYRGDWFTGGDLAHLDADGYLWYHGRHDDILKVMGYRLSPLEIEGVLSRHPDVAEVAVGETALADDRTVLTAFVVPAGPGFEAAVLLDWARAHLAGYKLPRKVVFLDRLPRTANGKLRRCDLPRG